MHGAYRRLRSSLYRLSNYVDAHQGRAWQRQQPCGWKLSVNEDLSEDVHTDGRIQHKMQQHKGHSVN